MGSDGIRNLINTYGIDLFALCGDLLECLCVKIESVSFKEALYIFYDVENIKWALIDGLRW